MNDPRIQILCEYCKGMTYNDFLGNCIACGAGREEKNMPEPEPEPDERLRWGGESGVESGNDFSMSCTTAAFTYAQVLTSEGTPFAISHTIRPERPDPMQPRDKV